MLYRDIFVLKLLRVLLRRQQQLGKPAAGIELLRAAAGYLGQTVNLPLYLAGQRLYVQSHIRQQTGNQSLLLAQQRQMQMLSLQLLLSVFYGDGLAVRYRPLRVLGVFFKVHFLRLLWASMPGSGMVFLFVC